MAKAPRRSNPTVADVAKAAGVSKSTASRVLGGYGPVGERARRAVMQASEELGYRPNGFARGMNTGRSGTIGVIHEGIENSVFAVAMRGIIDAAAEHGMTVVMMNTGGLVDAERRAVDTLLSQHVDGLIVCPASSFEADHLRELHRREFPLVLWERGVADLDVPVIEVATDVVMTDFVSRAVELGHQRIGFISTARTGPRRYRAGDDVGSSLVTARLAAMTSRQRELLGEDSADLVRFAATGTRDEIARVARELFETASPPSLLLTSDNDIALVVVPELERLGLLIPRDVSLATFDDAPWALLTFPKTSVIAQPTYQMAHAAAEALLVLISQPDQPAVPQPFTATVHWRGSVGPAKTHSERGWRDASAAPAHA